MTPDPHNLDEAIESAIAHHQAGRLQQAELAYRKVLEVRPDHPDALHLLGVLAAQVGQFAVAIDLIRRSLAADPRMAVAHNNLGNALRDSGRIVEAEAAFQRALELDPELADAHANIGNLLRDRGELHEAVASFKRALAIEPHNAAALNNFGNALRDLGQVNEARSAYERAIVLTPDSADAHYNLANVFRQTKQFADAGREYQRAVQLKPDYAQAYVGLAATYQDAGRIDEAIATNQIALRIDPNCVEAHTNLAIGLKDRGQIKESLASLDRAIALASDRPVVHGNRLYTMHFDPDCDLPTLLAEHREWDRRHAQPLRSRIRRHTNERSPGRRLKIGYVSPDFCNHPIGRFLLPLFESHDREQFEIGCYSQVVVRDEITERLRRCADGWREITYDSDEQIADRVRADSVDILVDLSLHTAFNRLLVFARKPAPVQVTWLGYPGTSGLTAVDYRLTDPWLEPLGDDLHGDSRGIERPHHLPDCFWCYEASSPMIEVNAPPVQKNGYVTFGCLNSSAKMNAMIIALWARILRACANSRLVLLAPEGEFRARVLQIMRDGGVSPERIEFLGRMTIPQYMKAFNRIDVALDPYPYNGHTTNFDATWMGVPIITLAGKIPASRAGLSVLCNLGLGEQAAFEVETYFRLAVELANDTARQATLRRSLRERIRQSPLMNGSRFARNVETAYRQMWQSWCASARP